jgi:hypothetical protein
LTVKLGLKIVDEKFGVNGFFALQISANLAQELRSMPKSHGDALRGKKFRGGERMLARSTLWPRSH